MVRVDQNKFLAFFLSKYDLFILKSIDAGFTRSDVFFCIIDEHNGQHKEQ